ncbi:unnamed protein product [Rotaria sp. Silwood1]|nr:unnamed protein product [Rotaria sp. Silwood1]
MAEIEKRAPSIDVQAWINDTKKGSPIDEKQAEQVWSVKIGQLHMIQAQNEKEKTKSSRALPHAPKKVDNKPFASKIKPVTNTKSREPTYEAPHDSYFDTLFEGDFFRKPSTNNYSISSSFHQPKSTKNKLTSSLNNLNTKHVSQRKTTRYEPPTTKRSQPAITTTSWRKQWPKQYHYDNLYPYYLYNEFTHRDYVHKDTDERFREALQKLRADRAEQQQQKAINDNTAKRLHYGDYVRHSTKDALLQTAVKPSPWSDFMDLKKGNLYSLSREEKKELYNQSKTYGERVRYRNFAMSYDTETSRSHRHSAPLTDDSQEYESGNETPRQRMNNSDSKSVSRTSKRPGSGSTANKTYPKQTSNRGGNRSIPNQISRTTMRTDRSNINRQSENDDDDDISNHDINHKYKQQSKKKNVRYAKLDSNGRTTNNEDENDNKFHNHGQRTMRTKNRDIDDDLFTVREEKTLESFEGARYKKR